MNDGAEHLLDDVFAESAPAELRDAKFGETLRRVRRRFRQVRRAAAALALLGLVVVLTRQQFQSHSVSPPVAEAQARSCTLVRTRPLPAADIVTTRPPAAGQLAGASAPVKIVQTTATSGRFRVINDEELLALLGSHPAALIRTGPHSEELVFANPADAKGFPPN